MMEAKEKKNLRVFGYGLAVIISFVIIRLALKHQELTTGKMIGLGIAAALALVTAVKIELLRPVYHYWMKGARFIGEVVNFVLLTVIFYVFFGIPGLILRFLRKDLLDEKIDRSALSYWKMREHQGFDRDNYKRQF